MSTTGFSKMHYAEDQVLLLIASTAPYLGLHTAATLTAPVSSGNTIMVNVPVSVGALVTIDVAGAEPEELTVLGITGSSSPYQLTLNGNISFDHLSGAYVSWSPSEYGSDINEPVGIGNYARTLVSYSSPVPIGANPITGSVMNNTAEADIPASSGASTLLGLATHALLWDAITSGHCWLYAPLPEPVLLIAGYQAVFPVTSGVVVVED